MADSAISDNELKALVASRIAERFMSTHLVLQGQADAIFAYPRSSRGLEDLERAIAQPGSCGTVEEFSSVIRQALDEARRLGQTVMKRGARLWEATPEPRVDVVIEPVPGKAGEPLFLIMLDEYRGENASPQSTGDDGAASEVTSERHTLQLAELRDQLQRYVRIYERMIDKLRSSYEKFRLVRQELAVSKQMLQVLNRQLSVTNAELGSKIRDVDSHELDDTLELRPIAILLLDHNLVVRSFTSATDALFSLTPADKGRAFEDYLFRLPDADGLLDDIHGVMVSGVASGREINGGNDDARYHVQILPHRDANGRLDGSLVVFLDIGER